MSQNTKRIVNAFYTHKVAVGTPAERVLAVSNKMNKYKDY